MSNQSHRDRMAPFSPSRRQNGMDNKPAAKEEELRQRIATLESQLAHAQTELAQAKTETQTAVSDANERWRATIDRLNEELEAAAQNSAQQQREMDVMKATIALKDKVIAQFQKSDAKDGKPAARQETAKESMET